MQITLYYFDGEFGNNEGLYSSEVRYPPANTTRPVTEDAANPLLFLITVSVLSTNRAALSLGGLKPNFILYEKRYYKEPPFLKGH